MDVILTGPLPTPAIAMLTREMRADIGVMISASHNAFPDNGIKLFGPDGFKLSDEDEVAIEALIESGDITLAQGDAIGRARRIEDARGRYIHAVKRTVGQDMRFDKLKVVVDCANGAAYQVAPTAIWELGGTVIAIGVEPNGTNINDDVGSTSLDAVKARVLAEGRRCRHRARRRCRPADRGRRERPDGRRRPAHGADRHAHEGTRNAEGRRRGCHGDEQPRPRTLPRRKWTHARPDQGRRPLRARGDARRRVQSRRRAVGPHDPARLRSHRRRHDRGAAGARRAGSRGQAGERGACTCSIRCRNCSGTSSIRAAIRSSDPAVKAAIARCREARWKARAGW